LPSWQSGACRLRFSEKMEETVFDERIKMKFINVHVLLVSHSGERVHGMASGSAIFLIESNNQEVGGMPAQGTATVVCPVCGQRGQFPII